MEVLMKILYIFDSDDTDRRDAGLVLTEWAKEHGHELVMRRAVELKPCLGCFGCWIRTPGKCVIPGDEGMSFVESMYRVDLVILAGETPYGSFSVPIKTILDRAIPLLLTFFRKYRSEMHHVPRYTRLPRMLSLSFGDAREREDATHLDVMHSFCDNISCARQKRVYRYRENRSEMLTWLGEELDA
jgi:multimeric flavodoxin WrbA